MAPKDTTRNQYNKGLGYTQKTPAFLLALEQRVKGNGPRDDDEEDYNRPDRPPIPTRPQGEESGDEESDGEKPQVVVLREGKHLTELEAKNEVRKAKGLPPLAASSDEPPPPEGSTRKDASSSKKEKAPKGLDFSSGSSKKSKAGDKKRKVIGGDEDSAPSTEKKTKKAKKEKKGLLSFGDGDD